MAISDDFGSCPMAFISFIPQEWLYREEFEKYEKEGVLQMHTAFSREQATPAGHVGCCRERTSAKCIERCGLCVCVCPCTWLFVGVNLKGTDQCR